MTNLQDLRLRTLGPFTLTLRRGDKMVPCRVWLTLDEVGIALELGTRALANKSRRSQMLKRLMVAEVRPINIPR